MEKISEEFAKTDQMLLSATYSSIEELYLKGRAKIYSEDGKVIIVLLDVKNDDNLGFVDLLDKSEDIKTDESNFPSR